jgi:4-hydroxy-3-polyprenylbenzoate decarboxylase
MIMSYNSLADFLSGLQDNGELVRIPAVVDSALELAAITDHVAKTSPNGGPALLFEHVKNSTFPVVTNLFGSKRRLCLGLGVTDLDELAEELDLRFQTQQPSGWLDALKRVPDWGGVGKWSPKLVKTAACQQVVRLGRDVNLWDLPIPRCWPGESDPVITSGHILTCFPGQAKSMHCRSPLVVTSQNELGWYDGDPNQTELLNAAFAAGQNLPVAISLGSDPVLTLAMTVPGVSDPRLFAGMIRGNPIEIVRCRTNELDVPASAEFIIEGYIDAVNARSSRTLSVARENGRFVQRELPLIQVTAITHRANPVFPATIISSPPSEEAWMELAGERLMLPLLRRQVPDVVDIHRPFSGAGRNLLFVSIHKSQNFQARRVLHALWGTETLGATKMIVIVDADVDVKNQDQVWMSVGNHSCPRRDFVVSDGLGRDDDYTSSGVTLGSRVGIDATRKSELESGQSVPESVIMSDEILARVTERWPEYGLDHFTAP